jgi:hypothetical protein
MLLEAAEGTMKRIFVMGLAGLAAVLAAGSADAQTQSLQGAQPYGVRTMSFESWCQQLQRLSPERCMQRRAEDVKAFNDYREIIERYDLQYLKQAQKDRDLNNHSRDFQNSVFEKAIGIR